VRNEIITLIANSVSGANVTAKETVVFAEKKSVRQSEFYAATAVGLKPELVFSVDVRDFETAATEQYDPTEILYNERHYNVIRTYCTGADIEITVGR
jgi:hypothetical protein